MMFGSVSEYFTNLQQLKRLKTCVSGLNALFRGTEVEASILLHWTQIDVRECFRAVHQPSTGNKMQNLCSEPEYTI
jgi:hypothetical protein